MPELGLFISSEEHSASFLVRSAREAESAGLRSVMVSDHIHPWLESQGHSPMVWPVLGALVATTTLNITTAVTCPTVRIHPAIIAQAAATVAEMAPGRFRLGVGSGEALNEHILGDAWPSTDVRLEMLEEAVGLMRELWAGGNVSHHGEHYVVDAARIYEAPNEPIEVLVSGFGPKAVELASRIGDGFVTVQPDGDSVDLYRKGGGKGPAVGAVKMCWAPTKQQGVDLAHHLWRNDGLPGELAQTLPMPAHFDQASQLVTKEMIADSIACGPDPEAYIKAVRSYIDAGFDEIYVSQIGEDLPGFLEFFNREVLPELDLS